LLDWPHNPRVTTEEAVIVAVRVAGSLLVFRWAFVGGIIAVLVDLSDLFLMNLLDLGGVRNYQTLDKWCDQVYMLAFLAVALHWPRPQNRISAALYAWRIPGFVLFELTGARWLLVLFPNVFEFWYLFVASLPHWRPGFAFTAGNVALVLVALLMAKELQEVAIHALKLLDSFTAVEAVEAVWEWLTGWLA
jgi:hypothetical protein